MKFKLLLKTITLATLLLFVGYSGWGQVTLPHYDGIEYTVGQGLQTQSGWTAVNTGDDLLIATGNLFYPGLKTPIGNKITFAGSGIDASKAFTDQTSGTVYYSFLMKVTGLGSLNATGGYFTGLASNSTNFGATVWTGLDGEGYKIGINPRTSTTTNMVWVSGTQELNSTVFVVVSYEIIDGTGNDIVNIWVNPSSSTFENGTAPTPSATVANTGGSDLASILQFFIRQDSNTETPFTEMDELRVGNSWAEVTPLDNQAPIITYDPVNEATGVVVNSNLTISFDEPIRNIDNSVIDNSNVASLLSLKLTNESGQDVAFSATIDDAKMLITINPDNDLIGEQLYYLSIADIEDYNNNLCAGTYITFTTAAATIPSISDVAITETEPYFAGDDITVTWTTANVDFVKIEAWVPSLSSWQEMIASTESDGSAVISIPADAFYSAEYKVRVSYVTDAQVNAESAAFTIIATPTIYDIQSNTSDGDRSIYNGSIVRVSGIVTGKGSTYNYFIQSGAGAYNGIYVYNSSTGINIGDELTIVGTIDEYLSSGKYLTELKPTSTTVNSSGNPLPAATTITTGELLEAYEGVLIKIINSEVKTDPNPSFFDFTIDDGTGVTVVDDDFYRYAATVGEKLTITGLGHSSYGAFKILPRNADDIQSADATVSSTVYTVDNQAGTITNVPFVVSVDDFKANLTPATNATFEVFDADETTAATEIDDTKVVIVNAQDGITTKNYTITRNAVRTGKDILTFAFTTPAVNGTVNATAHTVAVTVPSGTNVTALSPGITISDGADIDPASGAAQDFTNPVAYTVTAEDQSTQDWVVTVTVSATGIEEGAFAGFRVYPNPFTDEIKFEGLDKKFTVKIYSQSGQLMMEKEITAQNNRIHAAKLQSGMYMMVITNEKGEQLSQKMFRK